MNHSICTVVINYQTPDLLKIAVESFRLFYPAAELLIIDNGSKDNSVEIIKELQRKSPEFTQTLLLEKNIYHGPAMHLAIEKLNSEYIFFLDSDTETYQGGFLEKMIEIFNSSDKVYGTGRLLILNKRGFKSSKGISVPSTAYFMIKKKIYNNFPPFEHHGVPVIKNFYKAVKFGYEFKEFPIQDYVKHLWRGTAGKYGYGLGIKAKVDFILNKIGI